MGGPQPRVGLSLKVAQKQILTPGLVQMVSVLALNKLELREMINQEMIANPVLEELPEEVNHDSFEEIDFGSFFNDYLDPGYRSPESEIIEKPSFENFLSQPSSLTDHLEWQLNLSICSDGAPFAGNRAIKSTSHPVAIMVKRWRMRSLITRRVMRQCWVQLH